MKVLVVGGGGREHALCWKLAQSPRLEELYCAPGNPGIAEVADRVPIAAHDVSELADFAASLSIDLTVVGPEVPLTMGIADELERRGLAVFGPLQRAAELEGSKAFAKGFMSRYGIPTAEHRIAHDLQEAKAAVKELGTPVVLKADGLAAGKGVLIARDRKEVKDALATLFEERRFGAAADRVVVEECLVGEEVSFIVLSDGERVMPMATSKDYKRIGEEDTGPNTGGMGAHSPAGLIPPEVISTVMERIVEPTIAGLAEENRRFVGVLYVGLMLTDDGPKVLEYNVRFGDPETQPLMLRLEGDLLPALEGAAAGNFGEARLRFRKEASACIVLAAPGYPGEVTTGAPIEGLDEARAMEGVEVFHAGTDEVDGRLVTAGGRVLNVCAHGAGMAQALERAYRAARRISWPGLQMRRDIGRRLFET